MRLKIISPGVVCQESPPINIFLKIKSIVTHLVKSRQHHNTKHLMIWAWHLTHLSQAQDSLCLWLVWKPILIVYGSDLWAEPDLDPTLSLEIRFVFHLSPPSNDDSNWRLWDIKTGKCKMIIIVKFQVAGKLSALCNPDMKKITSSKTFWIGL